MYERSYLQTRQQVFQILDVMLMIVIDGQVSILLISTSMSNAVYSAAWVALC